MFFTYNSSNASAEDVESVVSYKALSMFESEPENLAHVMYRLQDNKTSSDNRSSILSPSESLYTSDFGLLVNRPSDVFKFKLCEQVSSMDDVPALDDRDVMTVIMLSKRGILKESFWLVHEESNVLYQLDTLAFLEWHPNERMRYLSCSNPGSDRASNHAYDYILGDGDSRVSNSSKSPLISMVRNLFFVMIQSLDSSFSLGTSAYWPGGRGSYHYHICSISSHPLEWFPLRKGHGRIIPHGK